MVAVLQREERLTRVQAIGGANANHIQLLVGGQHGLDGPVEGKSVTGLHPGHFGRMSHRSHHEYNPP